MREEIGRTLCRCLAEIGYQNAGTVEFLMDEDGQLHFIEMNTRIQVEHPITEAITGVDMVKAQLLIASGERLDAILPAKLEIRGHAIECRINAEHPVKFTPSAGKITAFNVPGGNGVRVDTAQYAEGVVPPYYDSLIAKLIVHGRDRAEAIAKMERALSQFIVQGIETSIPLHQADLRRPRLPRWASSTPSSWRGFWRRRRMYRPLAENLIPSESNRQGWTLRGARASLYSARWYGHEQTGQDQKCAKNSFTGPLFACNVTGKKGDVTHDPQRSSASRYSDRWTGYRGLWAAGGRQAGFPRDQSHGIRANPRDRVEPDAQ